ncbi:MAG: alpha/beta hydrolase [Myxococcales bacterium]|nr:alpha/beta hydrolase [Myxococcales bacterium]MCB9577253.1 alpha/beta hydrolase [Polyangiaceae bacterium]
MRVRVSERGEGPPVVLLHDVLFDHSTWNATAQSLAQSHHVVAPDLPGFGESEKPPPSRFPYTVDAFTEALADLYAGLGLGRAALVGHGLGGAVALTLAARHAELVSRLVLIDTPCYATPLTLEQRVAGLPLLGGLVFKQLFNRVSFRTFFRSRLLSRGAPTKALDRIDYYYDQFNSPAARGSALATLRATSDTRNIVARTSRVRSPTLVLWGRQDRLVPAALGQRLSKEIHGAGFELVDAGHTPQEEQPERTAQAISSFLA